jgi:hypothetical protein
MPMDAYQQDSDKDSSDHIPKSIKECASELEEDGSSTLGLGNAAALNHLQITSYNKQLSKNYQDVVSAEAATEKIQKAHMNLMLQLNKPSFLHEITEESQHDSKSKVSQQ